MAGGGETPHMTAVACCAGNILERRRTISCFSRGWKTRGAAAARMPSIYYLYYATQVMHHMGGKEWKTWNLGPNGDGRGGIRDILIGSMDKGIANPDTEGSWLLNNGEGRLMSTSLALLTLEVYYRHLPLYRRDVTAVKGRNNRLSQTGAACGACPTKSRACSACRSLPDCPNFAMSRLRAKILSFCTIELILKPNKADIARRHRPVWIPGRSLARRKECVRWSVRAGLGPALGFVAWTGLLVGQQPTHVVTEAPDEQIITAQEPGKPPEQYRVIQTTAQADGSIAYQLQS